MASNQIQQTGSFYLTGSFTASLGFDGTASIARKAARVEEILSGGDGIESFGYNGSTARTVTIDTSSAHFNAPINAITGSVVKSGSISGTTLNLHLGDGTTLANVLASASYAITASHALNSAGTDTFDEIVVTVLNYAGQDKYTINGLEAPTLTLSRAGTYRFDLSDATNAGHPLAFRTIADASYTTGVTQVGTPGTAGAYTEIVVGFDTPVNLRYYCTVHGNIMGNLLNVTDMFDLSATGSLQGTLDGTATTASLAVNNIVTASAVINRITFEKGDGSTFDVFVAQSGSIATASFAESVEYDGILNKPTLVSGSSQISYTGITDITPGLVSASAQITLEDTTFTDGDAFSVLRTDGAGNVAFDFADRAYFNIRAQEVLVKGDPIYVSGYSAGQDRVLVSKADASDPTKMPAIGLAAEALAVNANGQGVTVGVLDNAATNTFAAGDELYVANGGGLTATAPTGADEVQPVGIVIRSDAALGRINVAARMSSATAASATVDTGSLLTTASIDGVDITFTKGDASTFDITVDTGSSTADSASFSTRVTDLEDFSSSLDATYVTEAELVAATASLSSSLTTTDQTISSSVATLSGSASTARNQIAVDYIAADTTLSASLTTTDQTISSSVAALSASASTSRDAIVASVSGAFASDSSSFSTRITAQEDFSSSLDATYATEAELRAITASSVVTASALVNTITFEKGDGSTFAVSIAQSGSVETASRAEGLFNSLGSGKGIENFTFDGTLTGVTVDLDTGSAHFTDAVNTITSSLSASLTTTDQTISSSVAALSASASTSRDAIVASVSGAFASDSSSLAGRVTSLEDFSSSLDATYVTEAELVAATASLSASLTTTDQTISSSVATLSGSASDSRNAIVANISGAFSIPDGTVSSSAQTISNLQGTDIISGSSQLPSGIVSSSAQTIANLPAGTVSGSAQVTGSTLITGSVKGNTLTFEKGDGSTFDLLVITSSGGGGSTDTGSLLTTASVSETTMSFTKGDASTFEVYITSSVSASFAETASLLLGSVESASFASTASFVTASNVHGPHGISSVATASRAITSSKVDPISALSDLQHFVDDGAAGIGGIPKGGLYRNGNFVLIRIADIPFSQTHYLSSWGQNDYVDFGGRLTGFFEDNETWSYGWTEVASIPTGFTTYISYGTDDFAHGDIWTNATTRYVYNVHPTGNTTLQGHTTEPALSGFDSWLYTFDGTTRNGYLNGTLVFTSTVTTDMPSSGTGTGNITFGTDKLYTPNAPYAAGANSFYISDQVLGSSIGTTAFNNGGDITSDAEYSKVNSFVNVTSTGVIDITGNFTPTIQGTLTFTAVP